MLEPDDRHTLLDALRPPSGFVLDRAVGTTFTLDLQALMTAPVSFALFDVDTAEDGSATQTGLLDAIRRNAGRMDVFCQAGEIGLPATFRPLVAYVEEVVHEVTPPAKGFIFHPKLWAIRFRSPGGELTYRLLCLSRNLTFDRSWDTVLRLDGSPARRTRALTSRNRPLSKFVQCLPQLAVKSLDVARIEAIHTLADELLGVEFELPAGFSELEFWPLGIPGFAKWPFAIDGWTHTRLLVISPFLYGGLLERLSASRERDVLVSRPESLDTLDEGALTPFDEVLVLSPMAKGGIDADGQPAAPDEALAERPESSLRGLHAKCFISESYSRARIWTGSANATGAAFSGNVEFLVGLQGRSSTCGIDTVLEGQTGNSKLRDLLEPYMRSPKPEETVEEHLERRLDELRREVAALGLTATVVPDESADDTYSLFVRTNETSPPGALRGVRARLWPITFPSDTAKPFTAAFGDGVQFSPVSFDALTAFFAIELEAKSRGAVVSVRFVVKAALVGAPANRHDRLLTTILRNKGDVLRYLLLLLADESLVSSLGAAQFGDDASGEGWGTGGDLPLFESMVRALARDPDRLDHVERLIKSLQASEEGQALIPNNLAEVWEPLWEARERLRR